MPDLYILTDAFTDHTLAVEAAYSLGPGAVYGPPAAMYAPASDGGEQAINTSASNTNGVFGYNGDVYCILHIDHSTPARTQVVKSSDGGATWTTLDPTNAPTSRQGTGYFDGAHSVIVGFGGKGVSSETLGVQVFDLSTGTWGAVSAAGPASFRAKTTWQRPDGSILVLYNNRNVSPGDGSSGLAGVSYDLTTNTWGAAFDVGANLLLLTGWDAAQTLQNQVITTYMDAAGRVGVFFQTTSLQTVPVIWGGRCFYQQINLDNSLGSFTDFPGQVAPLYMWNGVLPSQDLTAYSGSPLGTPILLPAQNTIVLPVLMINKNGDLGGDPFPRNIACVYLGTPIANPVWSVNNAKTIDPGVLIDDNIFPQSWGSTFFDGTTIYALTTGQGDNGDNYEWLRLCQTTNLASPADGWSAVTAAELANMPAGFQFAGQSFLVPSVSIPASAAALPGPLKITIRGIRRIRKADCQQEPSPCIPEPQRPKIDRVW